ncbi:RdgB/HAM1 family non-canonical purine NTP pyrophosphatase [Paraflavisolibacter sp. H34]|uniref:RdgB/HAM1 family non-canonical purine NTP pyrophosphatase n=1 Tax=Huijunlia imazamoxiresistens TaxID=3127457 RepID=UPI0030171E4B
MKLIFATNNGHKVQEVKAVLPADLDVSSLREAGIIQDIPEPHDTLEENAAEKARTIYRLTQTNCFSEDTGLEVAALDGAPGVRSARYAGEEASSQQNIEKLLRELENKDDRSARFRTVVFLIMDGKEYRFEGICTGRITPEPSGSGGFGYDAVFIPDGAEKSFGEMTLAEKNRYSHRKKAMDKLVTFLNHITTNPQ